MSDTIYNYNAKQRGLPISYSRRRSYFNEFNPFIVKKHIQKTNRLSASHYMSVLADTVGSQHNKNHKHGSYDRYLRELKAPNLKSNGNKMGILSGCNCGEDLAANWSPSVDATHFEPQPVTFSVGEYVYAMKSGNNFFEKALVKQITDNLHTVEFYPFDGTGLEEVKNGTELQKFFECPCGSVRNGIVYISSHSIANAEANGCYVSKSEKEKKEYFVNMKGFYKGICL